MSHQWVPKKLLRSPSKRIRTSRAKMGRTDFENHAERAFEQDSRKARPKSEERRWTERGVDAEEMRYQGVRIEKLGRDYGIYNEGLRFLGKIDRTHIVQGGVRESSGLISTRGESQYWHGA